MTNQMRYLSLLASLSYLMAAGPFAQHQSMPPGMTHEEHMAQMARDAELKKRGALAMGFDQDATTHHFRLAPGGGAIEVTVKDPADETNLTQIRTHLQEIARLFAAGDFAKPFATHGEVPPGVSTMQARKETIAYTFEAMPAGGRVRISTADPASLTAVHEFLRYQIREHGTGDPLTAGG